MTVRTYDRLLWETSYRVVLPTIRTTLRFLPTSTIRRLRDRAERREARSRYIAETERVGILRRLAVDRWDIRSDVLLVHLRELRIRSGWEE